MSFMVMMKVTKFGYNVQRDLMIVMVTMMLSWGGCNVHSDFSATAHSTLGTPLQCKLHSALQSSFSPVQVAHCAAQCNALQGIRRVLLSSSSVQCAEINRSRT